jgi:hypothetical protein
MMGDIFISVIWMTLLFWLKPVGKIVRGFDFLGYRFGRQALALVEKTVINAVNKMRQLYEQKRTAPERTAVLDDYITRWLRWVSAGLPCRRIKIALIFVTRKALPIPEAAT